MKIKGKIHCFFEQSGVFKKEFQKLGYDVYDYDIQNEFGETDYVIDLFLEIENAYDNKPSIFDNITSDDLIMAFFPCIYFTGYTNPQYFTLGNKNYKNLTLREKLDKIIQRGKDRQYFYEMIQKMVGVCLLRNLRIIIENPWSKNGAHYLKNNFFKEPDLIDNNRTLRGDDFVKPTGYWFFNCEPTFGCSLEPNKKIKTVRGSKPSSKGGVCSTERSMINPKYARNFICDFILGKQQKHSLLNLF